MWNWLSLLPPSRLQFRHLWHLAIGKNFRQEKSNARFRSRFFCFREIAAARPQIYTPSLKLRAHLGTPTTSAGRGANRMQVLRAEPQVWRSRKKEGPYHHLLSLQFPEPPGLLGPAVLHCDPDMTNKETAWSRAQECQAALRSAALAVREKGTAFQGEERQAWRPGPAAPWQAFLCLGSCSPRGAQAPLPKLSAQVLHSYLPSPLLWWPHSRAAGVLTA